MVNSLRIAVFMVIDRSIDQSINQSINQSIQGRKLKHELSLMAIFRWPILEG